MADEDKENQENELMALASIFVDTFVPHVDKSGGSFFVSVHLPDDCRIRLEGQMMRQARALGAILVEGEENSWFLPVASLPPLELNFQYPHDYPSRSGPHFSLSSKWLSTHQLNNLCEKLDEIWESNANEVVIYQWIEFLKSETLYCLKITSPVVLDTSNLPRTLRQRSHLEAMGHQSASDGDAGLVDKPKKSAVRAVQDIAALTHLIPTIIAHDREMREQVFNSSVNTCGVCFEDKLGRDCIRFSSCGHVYCRACMGEHFRVKITEGDVKGLLCPEKDCETQALATQVKELVEPELYKKYDQRLLDLSLGEMGDIVFCPRIGCQSPVVREQTENMGICPACRFAFCILCKTTYHGVAPCKVSQEEYKKIKDEYESASDYEKSILEQRYGKRTLRQVIDDCNSEEWVRKHSKQCPNCGRSIQKYDGCNKMTCMKCRCYFCWLCFYVLPRQDPYSHYRGNGQCANRLFEGIMETEDAEEDADHADRPVVNLANWWEFV